MLTTPLPEQNHTDTLTDTLDEVIQRAADDLIHRQKPNGEWDFHAHLGPHFISQYYLMLRWFNKYDTDLDLEHLKALLLDSQLSDGSWNQVRDVSLATGELNATVFNYWALKAMGVAPHAEVLTKARRYILREGGLAATALFTKIFLSLFQNYNWSSIAYVPYTICIKGLGVDYTEFSQWVIPHLIPIAYLRHQRVSKDCGPEFHLKELWIDKQPALSTRRRKPSLFFDFPVVRKILSMQQPKGSWGGYTVSTLLSNAVLEDYQSHLRLKNNGIELAIARGFSFIEWLYFTPGLGAYQGALMDGHYWDTLLVANALLEAGVKPRVLDQTATYIAQTQTATGGFPYGFDFEYAPDVDDTAEAILMLSHWPQHSDKLRRSGEWLISMQNSDGGWGAFDRNNQGNHLLRRMSAKFADSVDLFDDSSADSTGHVLDALSVLGHTVTTSQASRKGIEYLKRTQDPLGYWVGRWGVNYLFGTTCAVVGLIRAGVRSDNLAIVKAISWLKHCQNQDGGFGESTRSYQTPSLAGRGRSTPSQTAWVLWCLCVVGEGGSASARNASQYLIREFQQHGTWNDSSVTGTGHPGLLYMNYPSYAKAFPLMALSLYRKGAHSKGYK